MNYDDFNDLNNNGGQFLLSSTVHGSGGYFGLYCTLLRRKERVHEVLKKVLSGRIPSVLGRGRGSIGKGEVCSSERILRIIAGSLINMLSKLLGT